MKLKLFDTVTPDNFFKVNASIVENELDFSSTVTMINLVDLTEIEKIRSKYETNKPSYTVFITKAIAKALMEYPEVNKRFYKPFWIFPRVFQKFNHVDIAIASEVTDPKLAHVAYIGVIRNVEKMNLDQVQNWLLNFRCTESIEQWQLFSQLITRLPTFLSKFVIRLPVYFPNLWTKYRGGVAMISSPAKYGVDSMVASWSSPIGISFGYVKERVITKDNEIKRVPSFNLTLNFDRRIISGAQGARFIARLTEILEKANYDNL